MVVFLQIFAIGSRSIVADTIQCVNCVQIKKKIIINVQLLIYTCTRNIDTIRIAKLKDLYLSRDIQWEKLAKINTISDKDLICLL